MCFEDHGAVSAVSFNTILAVLLTLLQQVAMYRRECNSLRFESEKSIQSTNQPRNDVLTEQVPEIFLIYYVQFSALSGLYFGTFRNRLYRTLLNVFFQAVRRLEKENSMLRSTSTEIVRIFSTSFFIFLCVFIFLNQLRFSEIYKKKFRFI